jgi:hypothetical protein
MASTIGKVRAVFTASTSGLTAGVNAASGSMKRLQTDVAGLRSSMGALVAIQGTQLFASVVSGAASAARSMAGLVVSTAETVSSQNDLAGRLGTTYGELAGLSYAGSLVGVSMDQIGAAMTKAQVAFANAANGSKTANAAFARLGLSVADLNGLSSQQQFEAIAQAISELPTEAQRAAAAVQIFGRAGAQLLPLFAGGAAGIQQAREEADRFGLTLTNTQSGNIDAMGDSFDRAQAAITGVIQQIVAYLAPAIENVTTTFTNLIGSVGGATIGQTIGDGIIQGARFFATIVDYFIQQSSAVWQYASQIGGQWNAVWDFATRVGQVFIGAFNIFEAVGNLVGGIIANAVAGLFRAGASLAAIVPGFGEWADSMNATADGWASSVDSYNQSIVKNSNEAATAFKNAFGNKQDANAAGQAIAGPFTKAIDSASNAAQKAIASQDTAVKQTVEVKQTIDTTPINEAVKGIDSRSREGVSEMFRLMRGQGPGIEEQQLGVLEQIAANTTPNDLDEPVAEFAF